MAEKCNYCQIQLKRNTALTTEGDCDTPTIRHDPLQKHLRSLSMSRWTKPSLLLAILLSIISSVLVEAALHNVSLVIEPNDVRRGQHATIRCLYDLEGAPLYSAKFYRGQLEFYRYVPNEFPNAKVFPFPGIHVDVTNSNATQVLIRNVGFGLTGNFSCEVSADAPLFSTATAFGLMQVVELPDKRPQLNSEYARYEPSDILRANCTSQPSRPRADLRFTINNYPVDSDETEYTRTIDNLIVSHISMTLQLQAIHFTTANANAYASEPSYEPGSYNGLTSNSLSRASSATGVGSLKLRCSAQIDALYSEYKEIELGTPPKDGPIPARVTLSTDYSVKKFFTNYFTSSAQQISRPVFSCLIIIAAVVIHLGPRGVNLSLLSLFQRQH